MKNHGQEALHFNKKYKTITGCGRLKKMDISGFLLKIIWYLHSTNQKSILMDSFKLKKTTIVDSLI